MVLLLLASLSKSLDGHQQITSGLKYLVGGERGSLLYWAVSKQSTTQSPYSGNQHANIRLGWATLTLKISLRFAAPGKSGMLWARRSIGSLANVNPKLSDCDVNHQDFVSSVNQLLNVLVQSCNKSLGTLVKFYYSTCFTSTTTHTPPCSKQKCYHEKQSLVISILHPLIHAEGGHTKW